MKPHTKVLYEMIFDLYKKGHYPKAIAIKVGVTVAVVYYAISSLKKFKKRSN